LNLNFIVQNAETLNSGLSQIDSGNRYEAQEIALRESYIPAAEQGEATAQIQLGYGYSFGEGVPQDDVQAVKWFFIAATQGREGLLLDTLRNRMSTSQIAEAERLSQEWLNRKNK
jgi:TPR repeat protein